MNDVQPDRNSIPPDNPRRRRRVVLLLPNRSFFRFLGCCQLDCLLSLVDPDGPHLGFSLLQHFHHILHVVDALQHRLVAEQVTLVQSGQMGHKVPASVNVNYDKMASHHTPVQVKLNDCVTSLGEEVFHNAVQVYYSPTLNSRRL